uniref:Uncharacterized protein n=1 Tax=Anguilla anguilla TaxID=7936 RepID=A0A0E9VIY3_ANGAN
MAFADVAKTLVHYQLRCTVDTASQTGCPIQMGSLKSDPFSVEV